MSSLCLLSGELSFVVTYLGLLSGELSAGVFPGCFPVILELLSWLISVLEVAVVVSNFTHCGQAFVLVLTPVGRCGSTLVLTVFW